MATTAANTAIKDRLAAVDSFHPATVNLFDGWLLDPGDVVTVQSGDDSYRVPIYRMDTDWKGSSRTEIQSTGSEKRPPLSALKRRSYGYGRAQAETEKELIRHDADIEKSKERLLLWATEEEWDDIEEQWQLTHESEIEVINNAINERVTQTSLNTTLQGYLTITANRTILGNVMSQDGVVTAASITTAINETEGTGIVRIDADHIILNGQAVASSLASETIECDGIDVGAGGVTIDNEGYINCSGITINGTDLDGSFDDWIVDASVSGNTLTLTKFDGTTVTFSKATTLSGVWGSGASGPTGVYTVTASPQGATNTTSLSPTGHWGNTADGETATTYYGVMKATINGGATLYDARKYEISAASKLTTTTVTPTSSQQTVTPPTGYIGFSSVTVEAGGGSVPPSSHIQVESGGHYAPDYSASGTQITSWVGTIRTAVNNSGYFYFDAWLSDNPSDKKRYYIKF